MVARLGAPVEVAVISDTHLSGPDDGLIRAIAAAADGCQWLLHAGDITSLSFLTALPFTRVIAVVGNMDGPELAAALPTQTVVEVGSKRIGLIHGWGSPFGLMKRVRSRFTDVDAVVFGHSHVAASEVLDGVLMFNPGAARGRVFGHGTMGILSIGRTIEGRIVKL